MKKRSWKICGVLVVLGALTGLIHPKYAAGFLTGALIGILLYFRNDRYWNSVVDGGYAERGTGILHFLINYALMAAVMIISVKLPEHMTIFASAAGLLIIKMTITVEALLPRKESDE